METFGVAEIFAVVGLLAGGVTSYVALMSRITTLEVKNATLEKEMGEIKELSRKIHDDTNEIKLSIAKMAK